MDVATALFANEAFYLAFSHRDFVTMESLWATEYPVVCIHPGWRTLTERSEIIDSWRAILANPSLGTITPHYARAVTYGQFTLVLCYEEVRGQMLAAANMFVEEQDRSVRLIFHQASACADPPTPEEKDDPSLQ